MQYSSDENNNAAVGHDTYMNATQMTDPNNSGGSYSDGRSSMLSSSGMSESSAMQMQNFIDSAGMNGQLDYENISPYSQIESIAGLKNQMAMYSMKMETSNQEYDMCNFDVVSSFAKQDGEWKF